MTKVTVYGGTGTIGGNQILVEDERGAFFLDFGMPFAERNRYYEEFLKPRAGRSDGTSSGGSRSAGGNESVPDLLHLF